MRILQGKLVAMQEWVKATGARVCIVFEGVDSAGKGARSGDNRANQPSRVRAHRLGRPRTPPSQSQMYIQRYIAHFPSAGEVVIFDRSLQHLALALEAVWGNVMA